MYQVKNITVLSGGRKVREYPNHSPAVSKAQKAAERPTEALPQEPKAEQPAKKAEDESLG